MTLVSVIIGYDTSTDKKEKVDKWGYKLKCFCRAKKITVWEHNLKQDIPNPVFDEGLLFKMYKEFL